MRIRQNFSVVSRAGSIVLGTALVAACGGSSGDKGLDTTVPEDGSFFDAQDGLRFAENLGSSVATLVGGTFSSLNLDGSSGLDTRTLLQTRADTEPLPCDEGSVTVVSEVDGNSNSGTFSVSFDACTNGEETLTGSMSATLTGSDNGDGAIQVSFTNFSATGPEGTSSINGDLNINVSTDSETGVVTANLLGSSIALVSPEDSVTFQDFSITATNNEATGNETLTATATIVTANEGSVQMDIDPPLESQGGNYPDSGAMTMTHIGDGSRLYMNAETGDPATFLYEITNADGVTVSGTGSWETDLDVDDVLL